MDLAAVHAHEAAPSGRRSTSERSWSTVRCGRSSRCDRRQLAAVRERRQQIGVLRAIGFQPEMIRRTLLLESTFISGTAIVVGTVLGLVMSYNVIADSAQQANYTNVSFSVPWLNLTVVFSIVYLAALAATLAPAVRASRVYPAEALRYQ